MPRDPLEEFFGGEAPPLPGALHAGGYGSLSPSPSNLDLLPSEPASDIDTPVWPRRFASLFPFKSGRVLQRVASMLLPSMPVGVFSPEDLFPDEVLGWCFAGSAQLAAQTSIVGFFNMANSGLRFIIEEWQATRINTAGFIDVGTQVDPPSNTWSTVGNRFRDSRRGFNTGFDSTKVLQMAGNTTANPNVTVDASFMAKVASGAGVNPAVSRQPLIVDPGFGILWKPEIVNEGINVSVWWRARLIAVTPNKVP